MNKKMKILLWSGIAVILIITIIVIYFRYFRNNNNNNNNKRPPPPYKEDDGCTIEKQCTYGQGNCDGDWDCKAGLVCIDNIGPTFGFPPGVNICSQL